MENKPVECWSTDEEHFNYDSLQDLLGSNDDLVAGCIAWKGIALRPRPDQLCDGSDVTEIIGGRACDFAGEFAGDYPEVSADAIAELDGLISGWIMKHCPPNFYIVKDVQEHIITEEDLKNG